MTPTPGLGHYMDDSTFLFPDLTFLTNKWETGACFSKSGVSQSTDSMLLPRLVPVRCVHTYLHSTQILGPNSFLYGQIWTLSKVSATEERGSESFSSVKSTNSMLCCHQMEKHHTFQKSKQAFSSLWVVLMQGRKGPIGKLLALNFILWQVFENKVIIWGWLNFWFYCYQRRFVWQGSLHHQEKKEEVENKRKLMRK